MSTWCPAKSLFIYYNKYLSEHISNRFLWEHILGILFTMHMQVKSGSGSQLSINETLLPAVHLPCDTQLWKIISGWIASVFNTSIHMAVDPPISSLLLLDCNFRHTRFPRISPQQAGESISCCLAETSTYKASVKSSPDILGAPAPLAWEMDMMKGPHVPNSWNDSGGAGRSTVLRGRSLSGQIPPPVLRWYLAGDKVKQKGGNRPRRRNSKSKNFHFSLRSALNQPFPVTPRSSSQRWWAL